MVDKCSSLTTKWQCLTAWNPWLWAPSEMTTECYETSLSLFANARGGRDTINCQMPGSWDSSWNKCLGFARGGMLAVGIDFAHKMGSIDGHRLDYNGIGVLEGQRHIPSKTWPEYPLPPPQDRPFAAGGYMVVTKSKILESKRMWQDSTGKCKHKKKSHFSS